MNDVRDLLMRTKRLFTSGQWTQGTLILEAAGTEGNQYCLIGGVRHAAGYDVYTKPRDPAYTKAIYLLAEEASENPRLGGPLTVEQKIVIFNDRVARGVDDVVALIDRAVEKVPS